MDLAVAVEQQKENVDVAMEEVNNKRKLATDTDAEQAKDSVDAETDGPTSKRVCAAGLSSLEQMPKELVWKIIECVPEAALELRKASGTLKRQVNDFAVGQTTLPLVDKLTFGAVRLPGSARKPEQLDVTFTLRANAMGLFFLRLQLLKLDDFKEEIKKLDSSKDPKLVETKSIYEVMCHAGEEGVDKTCEQLIEWLGRRVGTVQLLNVDQEKSLPVITKILEKTHFNRLNLTADSLPEHVARHALELMVTHNVKELELAGRFETTMDTVTLLRKLSTHVHAMQIYQTPVQNHGDVVIASNHLFGANDVDWAPLFIEMLSGEMDKLAVVNSNFSGYLSASGTDKLIETLPKMDKKVHFIATCDQYTEGLDSDAHKDYVVKVNPPPPPPAANNQAAPAKPKQFLQIVHKTRESEAPLDPKLIDIDCK